MKTKLIVVTILALLLVVFAVQNTEVTQVKLWFWQLNMARAILIFVSFAVGLIIGLLLPTFSGKGGKKDLGNEMKKEEENREEVQEQTFRQPGKNI